MHMAWSLPIASTFNIWAVPAWSVVSTYRLCGHACCRYGSGDPKIVFVERKTHRESWKGEESVKERIVLPEENVVPFLEQTYTVEQAEADLRAKVGVRHSPPGDLQPWPCLPALSSLLAVGRS